MTLCKVCIDMLEEAKGLVWAGTLDPTFEHHKTTTSLRHSSDADCTICVALASLFSQDEVYLTADRPMLVRAVIRNLHGYHEDLLQSRTAAEVSNCRSIAVHQHASETGREQLLGGLLTEHNVSRNEDINTDGTHQADGIEVTKHPSSSTGFRLHFDIEGGYMRTFLLLTSHRKSSTSRPPKSKDTSSDEVFARIVDWIGQCDGTCACVQRTNPRWYPKRVLDLKELKDAQGLKGLDGLRVSSQNVDLGKEKVHLVDGTEAHGRYVTLSHCWGKPKSIQGKLRLTGKTEQKFRREGIQLRDLCQSFRDAILFAYRLDHVRYIWIDSLCIIQPDRISYAGCADPSDQDWKEQSRVMGEVYRQSYLNISATAATDGDQGLFVSRGPEHLQEDEIVLNHKIKDSLGADQRAMSNDGITRCTLIDLSLWTELVEQAPVNTRGWVQQERLLSPRIIHFCHNQVAWECGGFQDIEGHSSAYTTVTIRNGDLINERHLKDFDERHGLRLRDLRLRGFPDPDKNIPRLGMHELWKYVVEVYSLANLTFPSDKLIALSGIAEQFSHHLGGRYVAGMWREHLESQLLWQVNERYQDGVFKNPARREAERAPSFSWAAIDTTYGVTYGEATDYGKSRHKQLFFEVTDCKIHLDDPENAYGLIKYGHLHVRPRYLRRIVLRKLDPSSDLPFSWRLRENASPRRDFATSETPSTDIPAGKEELPTGKNALTWHYSINLDAPESDIEIFASDAEVYCMPAAFGDRTVRAAERDLVCLLLLETKSAQDHDKSPQQFRRIGITRLSSAVHWKSHALLMEQPFEGDIILN